MPHLRAHCSHAQTTLTHAHTQGRVMATYQDSVEGRGRPSPLHMAQHSHTGVEAQPLNHQLQESAKDQP